MRKRMEITFEVEETIVLHRTGNKCQAFCPQCQAFVAMLTAETAAVLSGLSEKEVLRLIEAGKIHFVETTEILICLDSLADREEPPPA